MINATDCNETTTDNFTLCPKEYDGYICWPATLPGVKVNMPCPSKIKGVVYGSVHKAYRICMDNGKWERNGSLNNNKSFTHYDDCIPSNLKRMLDMCIRIDRIDTNSTTKCMQIFRNTRIVEMLGLSLSLISLVISLIILSKFRVLRNNRTKIHKHLFFATILHFIFRLIRYVNEMLNTDFLQIWYLDPISIILMEYTKTAMFVWMFIEGIYLHNVISVAIFQEHHYIKYYFYLGWILPALLTSAWLWTMLEYVDSWDLYFIRPYYWILEAPRSFIIVMNFLFLISIIRVLVVKLRESHTGEIEQIRKAVRAAVFLLPLMGITNVCFWIHYWAEFEEAWQLALWAYFSYFVNSFQGLFVSILFCFLNGEVQTAIRNRYHLHESWRKHKYTQCRNFTVVSTAAPEPENIAVPIDQTTWIGTCIKNFNKRMSQDRGKDLDEKTKIWPKSAVDETETRVLDEKNHV